MTAASESESTRVPSPRLTSPSAPSSGETALDVLRADGLTAIEQKELAEAEGQNRAEEAEIFERAAARLRPAWGDAHNAPSIERAPPTSEPQTVSLFPFDPLPQAVRAPAANALPVAAPQAFAPVTQPQRVLAFTQPGAAPDAPTRAFSAPPAADEPSIVLPRPGWQVWLRRHRRIAIGAASVVTTAFAAIAAFAGGGDVPRSAPARPAQLAPSAAAISPAPALPSSAAPAPTVTAPTATAPAATTPAVTTSTAEAAASAPAPASRRVAVPARATPAQARKLVKAGMGAKRTGGKPAAQAKKPLAARAKAAPARTQVSPAPRKPGSASAKRAPGPAAAKAARPARVQR